MLLFCFMSKKGVNPWLMPLISTLGLLSREVVSGCLIINRLLDKVWGMGAVGCWCLLFFSLNQLLRNIQDQRQAFSNFPMIHLKLNCLKCLCIL